MEFLTADVHAVTMMKLRLALPHLQRQALTQLVSRQDALAGLTCVTRFQTPTYYDRPVGPQEVGSYGLKHTR